MKKTFILFLCCLTLLQGCYTYSSLKQEDLTTQNLPPEENILINLLNGSVIESPPYHHIYTTEPFDFIYGSAKWKHRFILSEPTPFVGKLERTSIDSLKMIGIHTHYLICYLPDSIDIYFQEGDYVIITPDQPSGLWCAGILKVDDKDSLFSGRISSNHIKQIRMKEFDPLLTGALVVGVVVTIIVIAASSIDFGLKDDDFKLK